MKREMKNFSFDEISFINNIQINNASYIFY